MGEVGRMIAGGQEAKSEILGKSKKLIPDRLSVEGKLKMEILAETFLSASQRLRGEHSSLTNHMGSPSREGVGV